MKATVSLTGGGGAGQGLPLEARRLLDLDQWFEEGAQR